MKKVFTLCGLLAIGALARDYPAEASISVSGTTARNSVALGAGSKLLHCTVAAFYRQGGASVTATTADLPLAANEKWQVEVPTEARYIAFITSGGTGTCYVHPVTP